MRSLLLYIHCRSVSVFSTKSPEHEQNVRVADADEVDEPIVVVPLPRLVQAHAPAVPDILSHTLFSYHPIIDTELPTRPTVSTAPTTLKRMLRCKSASADWSFLVSVKVR